MIADKYRVDAVVGSGGSGTVYRAAHLVLDRSVAIKILNPALVSNPNAKARFRREARAASKLDHPFSVQVFDYGIEPDGLTYLAMELLEGRELFKVIYDDWPLSNERIVRIASQVLSVLQAAHDAGIVHRDLKPENIMLVQRPGEDGRPAEVVKVTDFGIAKSMDGPRSDESMSLTRDGTVHGTPEYMAPEQARGEEIDGRTDLYAVGVILYEMLTGTLPFTGDTPFDVILKQLTEPVVPPSVKRPGIDPRLEAVVLRALKKPRGERFPDARTMRDELLAITAPGASTESARNSSTLRPPPGAGAAAERVAPHAPPLGPDAVPLTRKRPSTSNEPPPPSDDSTANAGASEPSFDAAAGIAPSTEPPFALGRRRAAPDESTMPYASPFRRERHLALWIVLGALLSIDAALAGWLLVRRTLAAPHAPVIATDAGAVTADATAPALVHESNASDAGDARTSTVRHVQPRRGRGRR